jgi:transcriptional regulator with XRE-family HTH domain
MYVNLKLEMWRKGIRQNQLARLLVMDEALLSKIVNGFRYPTPEIQRRIATLLQSDERWLFQAGSEGGISEAGIKDAAIVEASAQEDTNKQ